MRLSLAAYREAAQPGRRTGRRLSPGPAAVSRPSAAGAGSGRGRPRRVPREGSSRIGRASADEAQPNPLPWAAVTHLAALAGVLAITFSPIFVRLSGLSPATVAFWRLAYALPAVFAAWLMVRRRDTRPLRSRAQAAAAGLFLACDLFAWHHSIALIGAAAATLVGATQVAFVGFVAWALYRERPSRLAFVVLPVVLGGVALLSGLGGRTPTATGRCSGCCSGWSRRCATRSSCCCCATPTGGTWRRRPARCSTPPWAPWPGPPSPPCSTPASAWPPPGRPTAGCWRWPCSATPPDGSGSPGPCPRLPALEVSALLLVQPAGAVIWAQLIFTERLSPRAVVRGGRGARRDPDAGGRGAVHRPPRAAAIPEPLA